MAVLLKIKGLNQGNYVPQLWKHSVDMHFNVLIIIPF